MARRRNTKEEGGARIVHEVSDGSALMIIPPHLRTYNQGQSFLKPYIRLPEELQPQRQGVQAWVLDQARKVAQEHGRVMSREFLERQLTAVESPYTLEQVLRAVTENVSRHERIPYATDAEVLAEIGL